ncbi:DUF4446 family protein [Streptomonospora salina]|uniref:DUF4446 domain-containing protein n=1 Tax=Streptomonospora salina TaxID=104205 RepID=A0A841ED37_9ACTN|nr:DUF4446 family protein [Streptomonospora salina]MBB5998878.1 hypothetical protein [Streptomonospora salina]
MTTTLITYLAVSAALAGLGGLVLGAWAIMRVRNAVRDCRDVVHRLQPDDSGLDTRAVRDVAVVRYDALEEMSGARSFSLALLNAAGNGVVVTSINGRTETRTYAKTIEHGRAEEALSPEEYRALRSARLGRGPGSPDSEESAGPAARGGRAPGRRRKRSGASAPQGASASASASEAGGASAGTAVGAGDEGASVRTLGAAPSGAKASGPASASE